MDTTTGRFISMDSYLGSVDDPVSLHKYLYANANPVNYIDPSGYEGTLAESEVVLYGMLIIASIMAFPTIDLSLLRNNNISIDYVNESVDLSKTVIWGIFEGTFSIANANEQFMNFVVHMAKSDKEKKKDKTDKEKLKNLGDADIKDLDKLPKNRIKDLGGEDYTQGAKRKTGKSRSDLYWDKEGNVYSVTQKGSPPQFIDWIPRE